MGAEAAALGKGNDAANDIEPAEPTCTEMKGQRRSAAIKFELVSIIMFLEVVKKTRTNLEAM